MQLAFQHNQRTLELGLQMADTLRAGVQVLAETQADCMKALVGSRSLFRNASVQQLPSPPIEKTEETRPHYEDEDEDDDSPDWLEQLQPVVAVVAQQIITAIMSRPSSPASTPTRNVKELIGDALDWRRVAKRNEPASTEPARTLADVVKLLPPGLTMKLVTVQGLLSPAEASRAMAIFTALEPEMYPALIERSSQCPSTKSPRFYASNSRRARNRREVADHYRSNGRQEDDRCGDRSCSEQN